MNIFCAKEYSEEDKLSKSYKLFMLPFYVKGQYNIIRVCYNIQKLIDIYLKGDFK